MGRKVLFSAAGGSDPVRGRRDGALLHICRIYQPDIVYLYLSGEMIENGTGKQCLFCLEKLAESLERSFEVIQDEESMPLQIPVQEEKNSFTVILCQDEQMVDVHKFNVVYKRLRDKLEKVHRGLGEEDELLVNVTSGTPAMISGLVSLVTLGEIRCKAIQVSTPAKRMNNTPRQKDLTVEEAWKENQDNIEEEFEDRSEVITCPTLSEITQERLIRDLIRDTYDYSAALRVAKLLPKQRSRKYMKLLKIAERRSALKYAAALTQARKSGLDQELFPVQADENGREDRMRCFEYALGLQVLLKRRDYVNFIRGITPLITDLFEMILLVQCDIHLDDYCTVDRDGSKVWDEGKLFGTWIDRILGLTSSRKRDRYVFTNQMEKLVNNSSAPDEVKGVVSDLREAEFRIRNLAAHEIIALDDETIKRRTGFNSNQIMEKIREASGYAGIEVDEQGWSVYDMMNQKIIDAMI